jgi:RNA-directed DNA polymerase
MRIAQYKILKEILEKFDVPEYIYAFEKNRSIPDMAAQHVGKRVILSLDLKDFFTSIKQYHLLQIFEHIGITGQPARTLSEICTYQSFVPQGALTSPKVSNILTALTFGPLIKQYCDIHGYTLTIYADDITISCDHKLNGEEGRDTTTSLIAYVTNVVRQFGLRINREKIKVMNNYQRQYVCGAVVNQKVNLQKTERYRLKAIVHNCGRNGMEAEALKGALTVGEFSARIMGKINWFSQLNPVAGNTLKTKFKQICEENNVKPTVGSEDVNLSSASSGTLPLPEAAVPASAPW